MKKHTLILALSLLSLAACALPSLEESAVQPGKRYIATTTGAWTDDEIQELRAACDLWRKETQGAIDIDLSTEPGDVEVRRSTTGSSILGRFTRFERLIIIDADALKTYEHGVGAMMANLIGQFARMKLHDGPGVLSNEDVRLEFTEADRASCREAGYCS